MSRVREALSDWPEEGHVQAGVGIAVRGAPKDRVAPARNNERGFDLLWPRARLRGVTKEVLNVSKNFSARSRRTFRGIVNPTDATSQVRAVASQAAPVTSAAFMKVGEIKGTSADAQHKEWIESNRFRGNIEFRACRRNCCGREPDKSRHPDDHEDPGQIHSPAGPAVLGQTKCARSYGPLAITSNGSGDDGIRNERRHHQFVQSGQRTRVA